MAKLESFAYRKRSRESNVGEGFYLRHGEGNAHLVDSGYDFTTESQNANHTNLANPREATQIPFAQFALFAPIRVLNPSTEKQSAKAT